MNVECKPAVMFVRTTENCNAGCFMCDFAKLNGKPVLNSDQLDRIAVESQKSEIKLIRFTGGEPLLDRHISRHVSRIHNLGIKTSIITNGYLLDYRSKDLVNAGLNQIIVSLDGSTPELHNKLRNTPHLFEKATKGLIRIKEINPGIITRVNTVASFYNMEDLSNIQLMLSKMNVDQWSIIPIKGPNNHWGKQNLVTLLDKYDTFEKLVSNIKKPRMLGFSKHWAGRNIKEAINYFTTGVPYTPNKPCELVNKVRFYNPDADRLSVCNCVPWRHRETWTNTKVGLSGLNDESLNPLVQHFNVSGPNTCTGCEPINVYLAENPDILEEDIFSF